MSSTPGQGYVGVTRYLHYGCSTTCATLALPRKKQPKVESLRRAGGRHVGSVGGDDDDSHCLPQGRYFRLCHVVARLSAYKSWSDGFVSAHEFADRCNKPRQTAVGAAPSLRLELSRPGPKGFLRRSQVLYRRRLRRAGTDGSRRSSRRWHIDARKADCRVNGRRDVI
jgi:hypothetical protein